ncbi:MAG: hypothetical protein WCT12_29290 [Verrucomicrobiota bacterium]
MNWKAGCGRTACPVWVEGDGQKPFSIHIILRWYLCSNKMRTQSLSLQNKVGQTSMMRLGSACYSKSIRAALACIPSWLPQQSKVQGRRALAYPVIRFDLIFGCAMAQQH